MKNLILVSCLACSILLIACTDKPGVVPEKPVVVYKPITISKTNTTKVFVHYMPWFETKETSTNGKWGYHWTMKTMDPDLTDNTGKRQIASFYYPLIGPYASGDKNVIEYHLLLMKYAGIDGIIIDWYGVHDVYDYAPIKANTEKIVDLLDEAGLNFSICYEDRTTDAVVSQGAASTKVQAASEDMQYLKSKFFSSSQYIKINNQPLLLVFGPTQLVKEADWTSAFNGLDPKPCFLTLWNSMSGAGSNAKGEFSWVYRDNTYLDNFYKDRIGSLPVAMGSAYPGFKDFYKQGGGGESLGWIIDHNNGVTLDETLTKTANAGVDYLQLVTWNDFGEGTMIEPTQEFGYSFINKVKAFTGVSGYDDVFESIKVQYDLRQQLKSNTSAQKSLDQSFYYFVSLQQEKAVQVLDSLKAKYPK